MNYDARVEKDSEAQLHIDPSDFTVLDRTLGKKTVLI